MKKMSFVTAMRDYFGPRPGVENENAASFAAELKTLTPKDRDDFRAWLPSVGYEIISA